MAACAPSSVVRRQRSAAATVATPAPAPAPSRIISSEELQRHSSPVDCWLAIQSKVYDVTRWVPAHPGGAHIYLNAGKDCTQLFNSYHPLRTHAMLEQFCIGCVELQPSPPGAVTYTGTEIGPGTFYQVLKARVESQLARERRDPRGGWPFALKSALILSTTAATYYLGFFAPIPIAFACGFAIAFGLAKTQIIMSIQHDANHGAQGGGLYCQLMGATLDVLGASSFMWKIQHNVGHHVNTNVAAADPDYRTPVRRSAPTQAWRPYHSLQHLYMALAYCVVTLKAAIVDDFVALAEGGIGNIPLRRMTPRDICLFCGGKVVFIFYHLVLPLAKGARPASATLLMMLGSEVVCSLFLVLILQLAHCMPNVAFPQAGEIVGGGWAAMQMRTTSDFAPGSVVVNHVTGGLNHQVIHHLFPTVCHLAYPSLVPILRETAKEFGLPYQNFPTVRTHRKSHACRFR